MYPLLKKLTLKQLALYGIRTYQALTSGRPPCCKYIPSCSAYGRDALEEHVFFYALFLIIWRILRCNPLSRGGYDPVPTRKGRKNTR